MFTTPKINPMHLSAPTHANRLGLPVEEPVSTQRHLGWRYQVALCLFALLFSSTLWAAEPLKIEYYEVRGENMHDLRKAMKEHGPVDENGTRNETYTKWRVFWNYNLAPNGKSCSLTSLKTRLEVTMTLPKWIKSGEISEDSARAWDEYSTGLRLKADQYYDTGASAQKEVERRLTGMSGTSSCKMLAEDANSKAKAAIEEFKVNGRGSNAPTAMQEAPATCIKPVYPPASIRNGEQGIVIASFLIGIDGRVIDKKIIKSSGFVNLDNAVLDALGKCSFRPAKIGVVPEPSWHEVKYVWTMQ